MLVDLEIALARAHNWSLHDIDNTDIESMMLFITRYGMADEPGKPAAKRVYCDQVNWL